MSARLAPRTAHPRVPLPMPRVVITGVGLVSPLGTGAWETFRALLAGRTLADRAAALPGDLDPVARVRATGCVASVQHAGEDPAVELAERAAREAATEAGVSCAGLPCFVGTSKGAVGAMGGMSSVECRMSSGGWRVPGGRMAEAVALGPAGYLTHRLRQRLGLGDATHYVAACASSLYALDAARRFLLHSTFDTRHSTFPPRCLVVTSEAALLPAFIHSYRRLGVLAPMSDDTPRPLDHRRAGFAVSELGAAVVLERVDDGDGPARGASPDAPNHPRRTPEAARPRALAELAATAVAAEAYDLIRPDPAMAALRHVADALFAVQPATVLHPHAPGTGGEHDPTEIDVLLTALRATSKAPNATLQTPGIYAAKGALGHGLGAAGLVSLVLAVLSMRAGRVPAMPWLRDPVHPELTPTSPHAGPCPQGPDRARAIDPAHAVFAAGFGGHVAGALIRPALR